MDVVTLKIATNRSVPRHTSGHAVYYRDEQGRERPIHPSRIDAIKNTMYLKAAAGRFNFSWDNAAGRLWTFPAGTVLFSDGVTPIATSTAAQPNVIIPAGGGVVTLQSAAWNGNFTLNDGNTDARYLGSLADLPALTYLLDLFNCSLVTGDLSDLPALTYLLCLDNCSLVTGAYTSVSGTSVPTITMLTGTGMSATDMDNTLIAYAACTKTGGTFTATGKTRTAASDAAVTHLTTAIGSGGLGWTVSGITKV